MATIDDNIYATPNLIACDGDNWFAADDLTRTTTTDHSYLDYDYARPVSAFQPTKTKGKQTIKCSKCGKKIAEYWYKRNGWEVDQNEEILCKNCHLIEKLKE